MGRSIFVDDAVENYIGALHEKRQSKMGIIIGQVTNQKDFVISLSVTPDDDADGQNAAVKGSRSQGTDICKTKEIDIKSIDARWLATHAIQVNRLLVGGVDIMGVFFVGDTASLQSAGDSLKQSLYTVFSKLNKSIRRSVHNEFNVDRILLLVDTTSRKITCRTYDIQDNRASAVPADWKYQSLSDKWVRFDSQLVIELDDVFDKAVDQQHLHKHIQASIAPYCASIENSQATINGDICHDLDSPITSRYKHRDIVNTQMNIDFFIDRSQNVSSITKPSDMECYSKISIYGTIAGRAYVHFKSTFSQAIEAMKMDLVRSIMARCVLLCEDLEITEGDTRCTQIYKPPSRVFAEVPSHSVCFCDYIFTDEEPEEVTERLSELLDVQILKSNLTLDSEKYPADYVDIPELKNPGDLDNITSGHSILGTKPSHMSDFTETLDRKMSIGSRISAPEPPSKQYGIIILISAVIVAMVSIILYAVLIRPS